MTKKIVLIVLGALLLFCGLGGTALAAVLTAATGGDGAIESGYHRLATETPALISTTEQVSSGSPVPTSGFGATTITISARSNGQPIFLGVARSSDVDGYLAGIAQEEVREINLRPYRVDTRLREGLPIAEPPDDQIIWVAQASGDNPRLEWQVAEGDYRFVLMNDDGSPEVDAQVQFGIEVNGLREVGIGALIVSILVALAGLALLIWGIRTRGGPARPAPATGYPTPGGPQPYGPPPPGGTQPYGPPPPGPPPPPPGPPPTPTGSAATLRTYRVRAARWTHR